MPPPRVDETARRRRPTATAPGVEGPLTFAYADPPYPGLAEKYYQSPEVDHAELIRSLTAGGYAGWALSTSAAALQEVLPLCPRGVQVGAWVKPIGASTRTSGLHNRWEPLIVAGGRLTTPGVRDWICAQPARFGGTLNGRKPLAFCAWLFDCLGMLPGDTLIDLFPGTCIVSRAWAELSRRSSETRRWSTGDSCDHEFIDSRHCLKCGWAPPGLPATGRVATRDGSS